eukprot:15445933-Alexandrium_andersonii.AAC.1
MPQSVFAAAELLSPRPLRKYSATTGARWPLGSLRRVLGGPGAATNWSSGSTGGEGARPRCTRSARGG